MGGYKILFQERLTITLTRAKIYSLIYQINKFIR